MPLKPSKAAQFLADAEVTDRKNGRVADKIMLALPRELDSEERVQLVRDFAEDLTKGRASWLAAFHDKGKDARNPHAHLVVRDRDIRTGRRVIGLSDVGSTERIRQLWEVHANRALERAGVAVRIDRRSLAKQGIEREPTIHEGPRSIAMDRRGVVPESQSKTVRNGPGAGSPERVVDYRSIDKGSTRPGYNRSLGLPEGERDYWNAIDAARLQEEMDQLRSIHHPPVSVNIGFGQRPRRPMQERFRLSVDNSQLPLPLASPGHHGSIMLRPAPLKPAAERITGVERYNPGAQPSAKSIEPVTTISHEEIIGRDERSAKEINMQSSPMIEAMHERDLAFSQYHYNKSKAALDNAMDKAYLFPSKALERMELYRSKHGDEALYQKLAGNARKTAFGRRPGSILSRKGLKSRSRKDRLASCQARRQLPELLKAYDADKLRLQTSQRALQDLRLRKHSREAPAVAPSQKPSIPRKITSSWYSPAQTPSVSLQPVKQLAPALSQKKEKAYKP
nr:MobA/MobL family protein [Rhizobium halophilum]